MTWVSTSSVCRSWMVLSSSASPSGFSAGSVVKPSCGGQRGGGGGGGMRAGRKYSHLGGGLQQRGPLDAREDIADEGLVEFELLLDQLGVLEVQRERVGRRLARLQRAGDVVRCQDLHGGVCGGRERGRARRVVGGAWGQAVALIFWRGWRGLATKVNLELGQQRAVGRAATAGRRADIGGWHWRALRRQRAIGGHCGDSVPFGGGRVEEGGGGR